MGWGCYSITPPQSIYDLFPNIRSLNLNVTWVCFNPRGIMTASLCCDTFPPIVLPGDVGSCPHCFSRSVMYPQTQSPNTYAVSPTPELAPRCSTDFGDNIIQHRKTGSLEVGSFVQASSTRHLTWPVNHP